MSATTDRIDSNGLLYILQKIKALFVLKETGKGLSTEDYTTAEKTKLGGISANAQVNVLEGVQINGVDQTISSKKVNLTTLAPLASPTFTGNPAAPTQATSDNSTKLATTAFVKSAISSALSGQLELHFNFSYNSVSELPATGVEGTFYFIPATNTETGVDEFEEYVWNATDSQYERVGAATLDLSDYFNTTNLPAITNAQIDTIVTNAMS